MPSTIQPPRAPLIDYNGSINADWYRFLSLLTTQANKTEAALKEIISSSPLPDDQIQPVEQIVSGDEIWDHGPLVDALRQVKARLDALESITAAATRTDYGEQHSDTQDLYQELADLRAVVAGLGASSEYAEVAGVLADMSQFNRDFLIEVAKGNIKGHSMVHKFGRNASVPNGSWAFVNNLGFTAWPLSAATTVRIKAGGNAADTAAGAGARAVVVQGINAAGDEVTETIVTAGAAASAVTTETFWRLHRAWVSSCGTYGGANVGAVTFENGAGGTDLLKIEAAEGQTQFAGFTIPAGKTGYLLSLHITVDAQKAADARVFTRADITDTTAPVASKRLDLFFDGLLGDFQYLPKGPELSVSALSDIWVEASGAGAGTEVSADFELLLVDN